MTGFRCLAAVTLCASAAPALAQDDFQQWLTLSAQIDASDKIAIQNEFTTRFSEDSGGLFELENSLLIGYKLSQSVIVWAGYLHNPQYEASDFTVMERRAREQVTANDFAQIGDALVSARLRLEQRWRDGVEGTAWRVRPYVRLGVPLGDESAPTLNFSAEPFFNLNNTTFQSFDGLERLRSAASISFPISEVVEIEAGYLNQHRFVRAGADRDDHVLTASLGLSF